MNSSHDQINSDWEPCQGAQLRQVVRQTRLARRNKELMRFASSVVMLLGLIAVVAVVSQQVRGLDGHQYGGISCEQTRLHLASYHAGNLKAQLAGQIEQHLALCPQCARAYERLQASDDPTAAARRNAATSVAFFSVLPPP